MEEKIQSQSSQSQAPAANTQQQITTTQSPNKKKKYALIIVFLLFGLLLSVALIYSYSFGQNSIKESDQKLSPTPIVENLEKAPTKVVFMREGEIWSKDLETEVEGKISKTIKVSSPSLSPTGNHIYYFDIVHATGGFPRYNMYVNDIDGLNENIITKLSNYYSSKIKWSEDGKYLGLILFGDDIPGGTTYSEEAYIYDVTSQKEYLVGTVNRIDLSEDQYVIDGNCETLSESYLEFCNEYISYINIPSEDASTSLNIDQYINSKYTKPNYKLTRAEKLRNGLVVLEYYTGEPQNPEFQFGEGGGIFVPGYDKGVTQTYSVLLDETNNRVVAEITNAVDTDFFFD